MFDSLKSSKQRLINSESYMDNKTAGNHIPVCCLFHYYFFKFLFVSFVCLFCFVSFVVFFFFGGGGKELRVN